MIIGDAAATELSSVLKPLLGGSLKEGFLALLEVHDAGDTRVVTHPDKSILGEVALGGTRDTDIILMAPGSQDRPYAIHAVTFRD